MKKFLLAAALITLGAHASASTVYTTAAAWNSAVPAATKLTFEGLVAPGLAVDHTGSTITVQGVAITSPDRQWLIGSSFSTSFTTGDGAALYSFDGNDFAMPTASGAFAFDLRGFSSTPTNYTITFSDKEVFNMSSGATTFFGVVLNQAVTGFNIRSSSSQSNAYALDNLAFGAAAAVPEPASFALLGLGLLGLGAARRRSAAAK